MFLMSIFDNDVIIFILAALFVVTAIAFLIYCIFTTKSNNKFLDTMIKKNSQNEYIFKFDFDRDIIFMYRRNLGVEYCTYRFDDFRKMIIDDQRTKFDDWIELLKSHEKASKLTASFAIKIEELFGDNYRWIRFSLKMVKRGRNIIYCSAVGVSSYRKDKKVPGEIINLNMFRTRVEERCKDSKLQGSIYCINCNMLDIIRHRYGQEIANQYLLTLLHSFHDLNNVKTLVGHYKNDTFLIYRSFDSSKTGISENLRKVLDLLNRYIEFDMYQFEIKLTCGVSILGEYSNTVAEAIDQASLASLKSKGELVFYDSQMDSEEQEKSRQLEEIREIVNNAVFNPIYYPIISLQTGRAFGYFSEINFENNAFVALESLGKAVNDDLRKKLYVVAFRTWIEKFMSTESYNNKKIFIFCDIDMLNVLEEVYLSKIDYASVNLVAVINSYQQILDADDTIKEIFSSLKQNKINLAVVAEESLQTSVHPLLGYVSYVVLPENMIRMVGIDQRMRLCVSNIIDLVETYDIHPIAWNINNLSQAEILKTEGIIYMNGPLFDNRSRDGNSIRRINKLMDEN